MAKIQDFYLLTEHWQSLAARLLSRRSCLQCAYDLRASNSRCPEYAGNAAITRPAGPSS